MGQQPVRTWNPPGLFTPSWPLAVCVSLEEAWPSGLTQKAPASDGILGLTWMNLSLEGGGGDSATQTAVWTLTAQHITDSLPPTPKVMAGNWWNWDSNQHLSDVKAVLVNTYMPLLPRQAGFQSFSARRVRTLPWPVPEKGLWVEPHKDPWMT